MAMKVNTGSLPQNAVKAAQNTKNEPTLQGATAKRTISLGTPGTGKTSNQMQMRNVQDNSRQSSTTSEKQIKDAIDSANIKLKAHRRNCEFSYHEETKRVSITIMDQETKEVIKEIPPEETLEMIRKIWEMAGLLIDEKR